MTNSDNRTYLTSVKFISFKEEIIPLMLILTEIYILHKWSCNDLNDDTLLTISLTDYSNNDLVMNWLKHFIKHINNKRRDAWIILICDEFDFHMTISFLKLCIALKILLFRLSPHFTHLNQSLNVKIFQSFKHYYTEIID